MALTRAVARLCGTPLAFPPDEATATLESLIGAHDHYLFVLVDGLGMNQMVHLGERGFFHRRFVRSIRSVFPSTTAAAITTIHSGEWPAKHAITGWFTHLPDHGATVIPLRAIERFTERPIGEHGIPFSDVVRVPSLYPDYARRVKSYTHRHFKAGPYGDWSRSGTAVEGYRNLANAARRVKRALLRPGEPSFTFLYLSEVDHLSHRHGRTSKEAIHEARETDRALAKLEAVLGDSVRMIVSADHGHIDVPTERHTLLTHDDPINELLECPPSGEGRVPLFHVRPGREDEFVERFSKRFRDGGRSEFTLVTPDEAEALALYGPLPLDPLTRSRLGTFIAISSEADAVEYLPEGKERVGHIGMHGGMSADEVEIPLFLA